MIENKGCIPDDDYMDYQQEKPMKTAKDVSREFKAIVEARNSIEVLNDINAKYSEWELEQVYYGALVEDYEDVDQFSSLPLYSVEVDDIPF